MKFYMAPMEGLTDYTFRNAYDRTFGQGKISKYFMPFISPNKSEKFLAKEMRDIDRTNNEGICAIPQVMANDYGDFVWTAKMLFENFGHQEINFNAGCPSGTVVSKDKGSGILRDTDKLDKFLYGVFSDSFIQDNKIRVSVKTRIGMDNPEEWDDILEVYNKYELCELIVHPRVRTDYYRNSVNIESVEKAVKFSRNKLCYNGDIFTRKDYLKLTEQFPEIDCIMLGRGLIADPALINVLSSDNPKEYVRDLSKDLSDMKNLHSDVLENRLQIMSGDSHAIHRMKEMWCYMEYIFDGCKKEIKAIKKSQKMADYLMAVDILFNNGRIIEKDNIVFSKKF